MNINVKPEVYVILLAYAKANNTTVPLLIKKLAEDFSKEISKK